jgi:hypothetical protein
LGEIIIKDSKYYFKPNKIEQLLNNSNNDKSENSSINEKIISIINNYKLSKCLNLNGIYEMDKKYDIKYPLRCSVFPKISKIRKYIN